MQFPESWLREYCNPPLTTQQIADTLTMGGLEVEDLRPVAPPFDKVVVGEIKECVQHPNADRLRVCQVDVGQGALLNIVVGIVGAFIGGFLFNLLGGGGSNINNNDFSLGALLVSFIGAVVLLGIINLVRRGPVR